MDASSTSYDPTPPRGGCGRDGRGTPGSVAEERVPTNTTESDGNGEPNKKTRVSVYLTEGQKEELQATADERGLYGPGAVLMQAAKEMDGEEVDTGVPFYGRRELPEPDYRGEMLLQSHRTGEERIEIRLSMLRSFYDSFAERAEGLGADPVNYMEDVVEQAAGVEGSIGWHTGAIVSFADAPGREL